MSMKQFGFPQKEHLKSKLALDAVFSAKTKIYYKGIKCFYLIQQNTDVPASIKCGVGVSKKMFKLAVHRNRVKRLLREAYRLENKEFKNWSVEKNISIHLFLSYQNKDLPELETLKATIKTILSKIISQSKY